MFQGFALHADPWSANVKEAVVAKGYSSRGSSSRGSSGRSGRSSGSSSRGVSAARLSQKSGPRNAFGGYTKVNRGDGTFRMRPSGS
jgi:hypothetical protein